VTWRIWMSFNTVLSRPRNNWAFTFLLLVSKYRAFHNVLRVITNIYNKKTKGPTLMELFTATGKLKKFFLTTRDVRCVHHGWHGTHRYDIQVLATHASTCWRVCSKNLNVCAVPPVVHTSNISSCQKKCIYIFFSVFLWLWTIPLR